MLSSYMVCRQKYLCIKIILGQSTREQYDMLDRRMCFVSFLYKVARSVYTLCWSNYVLYKRAKKLQYPLLKIEDLIVQICYLGVFHD